MPWARCALRASSAASPPASTTCRTCSGFGRQGNEQGSLIYAAVVAQPIGVDELAPSGLVTYNSGADEIAEALGLVCIRLPILESCEVATFQDREISRCKTR